MEQQLYPQSAEPIVEEIRGIGGQQSVDSALTILRNLRTVDQGPYVTDLLGPSDADAESVAYLESILGSLRKSKGMIKIWGRWIPKREAAYLAFTMLAIPALFMAVALMIASTAGFWKIGLGIILAVGPVWILLRVLKNKKR